MRGRASARRGIWASLPQDCPNAVEVLSAEGYGASIYSAGATGTTRCSCCRWAANAVLVFASGASDVDTRWNGRMASTILTGDDGLFW